MSGAKGRARPKWSWDIESRNWDEVRCVTAVSSDGDVERFQGADSLVKMHDVMMKAQGTWGAHAGGIYDTLLLMNVRPAFQQLLMSGGAVLDAQDKQLHCRDTFRWFLNPLRKVGEYVDKVHGGTGEYLKKEVDRNRIDDLTDAECLAYCESDSRILLAGMELAERYLADRGAQRGWTSGSCALNLLQALEPASWAMMGRHALDYDDAISSRECVHGARVENWASGRVNSVYCYDLKSAYPAAYANELIGVGVRPARKRDRYAIWHCTWVNPNRRALAPALDEKTGAGAGQCEGWLVPEEIADLESAGIAVRQNRGWAPEAVSPIGHIFVRDLFEEKERGSFFAKVFGNSLSGKFSQEPLNECWTSGDKPTVYFGREPKLVGDYWNYFQQDVDERTGRVPRHVQPIAAALILGRTRSRIYRAAQAVLLAGGEIYYTDTDSLHCSLPPERFPMHTGNGLGEWAFEGGPFEGIYLGPKSYCLIGDELHKDTKIPTGRRVPLKGALKGVPWKALDDGVIDRDRDGDFFRQARGKEKGADHRQAVFELALAGKKPRIQKEGIRSFRSGIKGGAHWERAAIIRTIQPTSRGKAHRGTDWEYLAPGESLAMAQLTAPSPDDTTLAGEDDD